MNDPTVLVYCSERGAPVTRTTENRCVLLVPADGPLSHFKIARLSQEGAPMETQTSFSGEKLITNQVKRRLTFYRLEITRLFQSEFGGQDTVGQFLQFNMQVNLVTELEKKSYASLHHSEGNLKMRSLYSLRAKDHVIRA